MSSLWTVSDYAAALAALRPRGRVWPTDPAADQMQSFAGMAPSFERLDAGAQALLVDAFPATAVNLLTEWEETLSLDQASEPSAERQVNVVARLVALGGQSAAYFEAYAANLGFTVAVQTYAPSRCGLTACGDGIGGAIWSFAWSITVTANSGSMTNAQLLAALKTIAPAETTVFLAA